MFQFLQHATNFGTYCKTCSNNAIIIDLNDDRLNRNDAILIMLKYGWTLLYGPPCNNLISWVKCEIWIGNKINIIKKIINKFFK